MSSRDRNAKWGECFPDIEKWKSYDYVCPPCLYRPKRWLSSVSRDSPYPVRELHAARTTLLESVLMSAPRRGPGFKRKVGIPEIIPTQVYDHVFQNVPYDNDSELTEDDTVLNNCDDVDDDSRDFSRFEIESVNSRNFKSFDRSFTADRIEQKALVEHNGVASQNPKIRRLLD